MFDLHERKKQLLEELLRQQCDVSLIFKHIFLFISFNQGCYAWICAKQWHRPEKSSSKDYRRFKALFFLILSFVIYRSHQTPKSTLAIPENVIRDAGQIGAQEFLENRSTVNNQIYNQTLGHFVLVLG